MKKLILLFILLSSNVMAQSFVGPTYLAPFREDHTLQAINEIKEIYGDNVSIQDKKKSLIKYGENDSVGATSTTIMTLQGSATVEFYETSNLITHVASSSASDTNIKITIEGHTISGNNLTFVVQDATLNGQTKVALTTPLARATRAYNTNSVNLVGAVSIAEDVTFSSGVPTVDSATHLIIPAGKNQTRKASTSVSSTDYWIITNFYCDILEKASAFAVVELQTRQIGHVFREIATLSCSNNSRGVFNFSPYLVIPKNSDVRLQATASGASIDVSGGMMGYLASVED